MLLQISLSLSFLLASFLPLCTMLISLLSPLSLWLSPLFTPPDKSYSNSSAGTSHLLKFVQFTVAFLLGSLLLEDKYLLNKIMDEWIEIKMRSSLLLIHQFPGAPSQPHKTWVIFIWFFFPEKINESLTLENWAYGGQWKPFAKIRNMDGCNNYSYEGKQIKARNLLWSLTLALHVLLFFGSNNLE